MRFQKIGRSSGSNDNLDCTESERGIESINTSKVSYWKRGSNYKSFEQTNQVKVQNAYTRSAQSMLHGLASECRSSLFYLSVVVRYGALYIMVDALLSMSSGQYFIWRSIRENICSCLTLVSIK